MENYPKDIFEKLEFNKLLQLIAAECLGADGKQIILNTQPLTQKEEIEVSLHETDEYKKCIERGAALPCGSYENIASDLFLLSKEGYVLEVESIQRIHRILFLGTQVYNYFQDYIIQKAAPHLSKIGLSIDLDSRLIKDIERIFDDEGNVRPNASEGLLKISKAIQNKERETEKTFHQELLFYRERGYLTEGFESIRNGRTVLMVAAEYKRKIPGIIHDESATGKTVFIEPEKALALNNEVHNLYAERRAEIYKIIRELCHQLRPFGPSIESTFEAIARLDAIRAKARFGLLTQASRPIMGGKAGFDLKEARNPLLFLRLKELERKTVSFDLSLDKTNRFLILSGPNAGGKSVTLKTIGLLHLMAQSGILVTANENSRMSIFHHFYADIGDQQSLEDDLSTYSSHLANMKYFLENADDKTLVLIDEFGSGTDPKIGGGIAEAILKKLQQIRCFGTVTTHYSNLKYFAFKNHGFINGSMEFDKKGLIPTYQLMVGKPGSSFAFEIAEKTGLPEDVIEYAKKRAGKHEQSMEEMLVNLQAERQEFEKKMTLVLEKEERLDRLMKTYDQLHGELEFRRKKLKLEQKEATLYQQAEMQKELQKMLKNLKATTKPEEVQKVLEEKKADTQVIAEQIGQIKTEMYTHTVKTQKAIEVGGYAQVRNGTSIGKILGIDKDTAELEMGFFKIKVPLKDLIPSNKPIETQRENSVNTSHLSGLGSFDSKLDIRGYRAEEAMVFLEEFLEKAIINNAHELRIIHGVGNGTLKRKVHEKFREYKDIKKYWHPEENLGGEGVTYVNL